MPLDVKKLRNLIPPGKAAEIARHAGKSRTWIPAILHGADNLTISTLDELAAAVSKVTGKKIGAADLLVKKTA